MHDQLRESLAAGRSLYGVAITTASEFFRQLDRDESGFVDARELAEGLDRLDVPLSQKQLKELFGNMDADGDGRLGYHELLLELETHSDPLLDAVLDAHDAVAATSSRVAEEPAVRQTSSLVSTSQLQQVGLSYSKMAMIVSVCGCSPGGGAGGGEG